MIQNEDTKNNDDSYHISITINFPNNDNNNDTNYT